MVTILKADNEGLGHKIGTGLGQGLAALAHHKVNKMKTREEVKMLESVGFPTELATLFPHLPEKSKNDILSQVDWSRLGNRNQQQQNQQQEIEHKQFINQNKLDPRQFQNQMQPEQQRNQQPRQQQNQNQGNNQFGVGNMQQANRLSTENILKSLSGQQFNPQQFEQRPQQQMQQQQIQQQQMPQQPISSQPTQQFGQAAAQQQTAQQFAQNQQLEENRNIFRSPQQEESFKEQGAARTRRQVLLEKYADEKIKSGEEAERKLGLIKNMESVVNKLSGPTRSNLSSLTGTKGSLTSAETQQFDKWAADLIGENITQEQIRQGRLKYPNSGLSKTANKRLLKEFEKKYKEEIQEGNLAEDIIERNNGLVPNDFHEIFKSFKKQGIEQKEPDIQLKKKESEILAPQLQQDIESEESTPASLLRNTVSAGAKSVSDVANLAKIPEQLHENAYKQGIKSAEETLSNPDVPEHLKKALRKYTKEATGQMNTAVLAPAIEGAHELIKAAFPENYLLPKSEDEAVLQDYASMIPLFIMTGGKPTLGSITGFLARTAAGRALGEEVEEAGFGKTGKLLTEIVVPSLLSTLNPFKVSEKFKELQAEQYDNILPQLAGDNKVNASELEKGLESAWEQASKSAGRSRHADNINEWRGYIDAEGKFPLQELQPLKKQVNNLAYNQNNESYKPIAAALRKMGKETIKTHPEYGKALEQADYITKIYADSTKMSEFVENMLSSVPITKKGWFKKGFQAIYENPAVKNTINEVRLFKNYPKSFLKYAIEATKAAKASNKASFITAVSNIGKLSEEE